MRTLVPLAVGRVEQDVRRRTRGNRKTCRKGNESAGSVAGMKVSLGACFPSLLNRRYCSINSTPKSTSHQHRSFMSNISPHRHLQPQPIVSVANDSNYNEELSSKRHTGKSAKTNLLCVPVSSRVACFTTHERRPPRSQRSMFIISYNTVGWGLVLHPLRVLVMCGPGSA